MLDTSLINAPIVFLHIPKTAGQTIHNEVARAVGHSNVSPIRLHSQTSQTKEQFPVGYRFYSGHLDWVELDRLAKPRFTFSILRDPRERIASFYFYILKEAKTLDQAAREKSENFGKDMILRVSVDDYFFGGDDAWRSFVYDHYDNFYCRYFGSQKIRAGIAFSSKPDRGKLRSALRNLDKLDWIYSLENLTALEADLNTLYGFDLDFDNNRTNVGERPVSDLRWPRLMEMLEKDSSREKLEGFVDLDFRLMQRLEL